MADDPKIRKQEAAAASDEARKTIADLRAQLEAAAKGGDAAREAAEAERDKARAQAANAREGVAVLRAELKAIQGELQATRARCAARSVSPPRFLAPGALRRCCSGPAALSCCVLRLPHPVFLAWLLLCLVFSTTPLFQACRGARVLS